MKEIIKKCSSCENEFKTKHNTQCSSCLDKQYHNMFIHAGIYTEQEILQSSQNRQNGLWTQARINIQKAKEAELRIEIREEYKKLKFESERISTDEELSAEIRRLYDKLCRISATGMGDAYVLGHYRTLLKEIITNKKYHPKELEEIKKFIDNRKK